MKTEKGRRVIERGAKPLRIKCTADKRVPEDARFEQIKILCLFGMNGARIQINNNPLACAIGGGDAGLFADDGGCA